MLICQFIWFQFCMTTDPCAQGCNVLFLQPLDVYSDLQEVSCIWYLTEFQKDQNNIMTCHLHWLVLELWQDLKMLYENAVIHGFSQANVQIKSMYVFYDANTCLMHQAKRQQQQVNERITYHFWFCIFNELSLFTRHIEISALWSDWTKIWSRDTIYLSRTIFHTRWRKWIINKLEGETYSLDLPRA